VLWLSVMQSGSPRKSGCYLPTSLHTSTDTSPTTRRADRKCSRILICVRGYRYQTHTHTHAYVNTWNLTALQYLQARFPSADDRNGMGSFGRCHRTAGDPVSAGHFDFRYQIQPGNIRDFLDSSHGDDASPSSHLSWLWLELLVGNGLAKTIRVMAHPAAAVLLSSSAALL
jgi:hypothetical protein